MHGNKDAILEGEQLNCETCGSKFATNIDLQNHIKRHSSEIGGGKFQCEHCLVYMGYKHSLRLHIRMLHGNKEVILEGEQLNCETCGSGFAMNIDLQNHMKRHSSEIGGGKFQCFSCFIYLDNKH